MLHAMAAVYTDRRQFEKAEHPLRDAVSISECPAEKGMTWRVLGELRIDQGEYGTALEAALQAQEAFQEDGDRRGEASALMVASSAHNLGGSVAKAMAAARLAYELVFVAGDFKREAVVLQMMAELQMAQSQFDEAVESLNKAASACNEQGDARGAAGTMRMIADVYFDCDVLHEAERTAKQAQELYASIKDDEGDAVVQLLLSKIYNRMYEKEKHDWFLTSMRMAASQAVMSAGRTGLVALQASAAFSHAQAMLLGTDSPPEDALKLARRAQGLFKECGDSRGEAHAHVLIGYMLIPKGENAKAKESLAKAVSLAQSVGATEAEAKAQEGLDFIEQLSTGMVPVQMGRQGRPGRGDAGPMQAGGEMQMSGGGGGGPVGQALDSAIVKAKIMDLVRNAIGTDDEVEAESALMDAGMDSLSATDFTGQVAREFKLGTSPSLVFDYPTVREITAHIVEESRG